MQYLGKSLIALLESLKSHPPFSFLDNTSLKMIEKSAHIAYYPKNTTLIDTDNIPQTIYYIIKGTVDVKNEDELLDVYHSYDTFGGIEIIEKKPSEYNYIVSEELISYEIPAKILLDLCGQNKAFKEYFFSSLIDRMDMINDKKEYAAIGDLMVARVEKSILHKACVVAANKPIIEALRHMHSSNATCLLVENEEGYGIVTDQNFRRYILDKEVENLEMIKDIQTYPIYTMQEGELLFNILLLMTGQSIKHLPILDENNNVSGVLELIDLLSYFSNQTHLITAQMEKAGDLDAVVSAASRMNIMIEALHTKGIKSRYIAKLISEINRKMYHKIFEFVIPEEWHEKVTFILLGSEGREEQILRTDQDNALIFEDGFTPHNVEEVTEKFISVLDEMGFPRCEGNVMIINPKWRKSVSGYKQDIRSWLDEPTYDGFIDMAIFFDSLAICANTKLHDELIEYLISKVSENKIILSHFARSIQTFESPLGLFSQFISADKEHKNEIDIKKGALFALVHGVRALALEHGIKETNTTVRIKALNNVGYLTKEDASDLIEALEVINTLRLHAQLGKVLRDVPIDNFISLGNIGKLERDLLKESLKMVNHFKKRVTHHFNLSMIG
ncbi:putative nucleotidyltransferase substrate binding domain-containing protein [Campylobacterota bacterium]